MKKLNIPESIAPTKEVQRTKIVRPLKIHKHPDFENGQLFEVQVTPNFRSPSPPPIPFLSNLSFLANLSVQWDRS